MGTKSKRQPDSTLAAVAAALEGELEQLEALTRRVGKIELTAGQEIVRSARELQRALETHQRFVALLNELTEGVTSLRDRQAAAIGTLQTASRELESRRNEYAELEQRFGYLGQTAQAINDIVQAGEGSGGTVAERVGAAIERLAAAAEEARVLAADARVAGFGDIEQQADAARQQLGALRGKLEQAREAERADAEDAPGGEDAADAPERADGPEEG